MNTPSPGTDTRPFHRKAFALSVTVLVVLLIAWSGWMSAGKRLVQQPSAFAQAVDLSALENMAVHTDGRLKSFASHANTFMDILSGPRRIEGQSSPFSYLDLMFRPNLYKDDPICFVKHKELREEILDALEGSSLAMPGSDRYRPDLDERAAFFRKWGLIPPALLEDAKVSARLATLSEDNIRWAKHVNQVNDSLGLSRGTFFFELLRVVPPYEGGALDAWGTIIDLQGGTAFAERMPQDVSENLLASWRALRDAWVDMPETDASRPEAEVAAEKATLVARTSRAFADALAAVNAAVYPPRDRLAWESWYFRNNSLNFIWMVYLVSFVLLLLALVYGWRGARAAGLTVFMVAFLMQTASIGLRWWIAGRWPNSNMFEAVTTSAWFGGVAAVLFWMFGRSALMRHLCILTSAAASMVALMCANFMPLHLNPNISNMMPVLHDVWLYVHTNVIIASYILIFMAAVSAALYLLWRACGGAPSSVTLAGTSLMSDLSRGELRSVAAGALPAASAQRGRSAEPVSGSADELHAATQGDIDLGVILDGVTMLLMKVSFVMLWAGIVMGAIWADHSWGRPWGWDPKEVFALNTFLIFALLVHVRLKARDKGYWTAWLAVIGAGVMLFNWVVINFLITGLHSYA